MGEPRMARVDVSILVREKGAKVKKGKYLYIIASKDFPKGPGNPISGSAYVENTTVNRMALQCREYIDHPWSQSTQPVGTFRTDTAAFRNGKETDGPEKIRKNYAMQTSGSRRTSC